MRLPSPSPGPSRPPAATGEASPLACRSLASAAACRRRGEGVELSLDLIEYQIALRLAELYGRAFEDVADDLRDARACVDPAEARRILPALERDFLVYLAAHDLPDRRLLYTDELALHIQSQARQPPVATPPPALQQAVA